MKRRLLHLGLLTLVIQLGCGEDAPEPEEDLPPDLRSTEGRGPRIDQTNSGGGFGTGPLARANGDVEGESAAKFYGSMLFDAARSEREGAPEQVLAAECELGKVHLYLQQNGVYRMFCDAHPEINTTGKWYAEGQSIKLDKLGTARGYFSEGKAWIRMTIEETEAWPAGERPPHALDFQKVREERPLRERVRAEETRRRTRPE